MDFKSWRRTNSMTDKLDGLSLDLEEINKEKLKSVFPAGH